MVKRWNNWCGVTHGHRMQEQPGGLYVTFDDYDALAARLENACAVSTRHESRAIAAEARLAEEKEFSVKLAQRCAVLTSRLAEAVECCTIKDNRNLWLEIRLKKIMARCADLLDEDQFNELDAMTRTTETVPFAPEAK